MRYGVGIKLGEKRSRKDRAKGEQVPEFDKVFFDMLKAWENFRLSIPPWDIVSNCSKYVHV